MHGSQVWIRERHVEITSDQAVSESRQATEPAAIRDTGLCYGLSMQEIHKSSQAGNSLNLEVDNIPATADGHDEKLTPAENQINKISDSGKTKIQKFKIFDKIVRCGQKMYVEMGLALDEIARHELWKDAEYKSWNAYCKDLCGISRSHANRLILSAKIAVFLSKQTPAGYEAEDMVPCSESQVRPLSKLKEQAQWVDAWCQAVKIANGQPTQKNVEDVVREMTGVPVSKSSEKLNLREIVKDVVERIRILIAEGRPSEEIKALLIEIEEAVKPKSKGEV